MNKKLAFGLLALICFLAAGAMYNIGHSSSHLAELKSFWFLPLPLGALLLFAGTKQKNSKD
ncbi:MAG: hypothetical protein ACK4K0_07670 [Flavobacteriales bacterium]